MDEIVPPPPLPASQSRGGNSNGVVCDSVSHPPNGTHTTQKGSRHATGTGTDVTASVGVVPHDASRHEPTHRESYVSHPTHMGPPPRTASEHGAMNRCAPSSTAHRASSVPHAAHHPGSHIPRAASSTHGATTGTAWVDRSATSSWYHAPPRHSTHDTTHSTSRPSSHRGHESSQRDVLRRMEHVATVWLHKLLQLSHHHTDASSNQQQQPRPWFDTCIDTLQSLLRDGGFKSYHVPSPRLFAQRLPLPNDLPGLVATLHHRYTCLVSHSHWTDALADWYPTTDRTSPTPWDAELRHWLNLDLNGAATGATPMRHGTSMSRPIDLTGVMPPRATATTAATASDQQAAVAQWMRQWHTPAGAVAVPAPIFSPIQKAPRRESHHGSKVHGTAGPAGRDPNVTSRRATPAANQKGDHDADANDDGRNSSPTDVTMFDASAGCNTDGSTVDCDLAPTVPVETPHVKTAPVAKTVENQTHAWRHENSAHTVTRDDATVSTRANKRPATEASRAKVAAPTTSRAHQLLYEGHMRHWIMGLYHASKCPHDATANGGNTKVCFFARCAEYKQVWHHVCQTPPTCTTAQTLLATGPTLATGRSQHDDVCHTLGSNCRWAHEALYHYQRCKQSSCAICGPLMEHTLPRVKEELRLAQEIASQSLGASQPPSVSTEGSQPAATTVSAAPPPVPKSGANEAAAAVAANQGASGTHGNNAKEGDALLDAKPAATDEGDVPAPLDAQPAAAPRQKPASLSSVANQDNAPTGQAAAAAPLNPAAVTKSAPLKKRPYTLRTSSRTS